MENKELLTVEQVSMILGISEWTIKEMARRDMLPHEYLRRNRRGLRFDAEGLFAYFADREGVAG